MASANTSSSVGASSSRWRTSTPASSRAHDRGDLGGPADESDGQHASAGHALLAEPRQRVLRGGLLLGRDLELERRRADRRLQVGGPALAHDAAVIDDRDAAGELVGLLEVLRREEDRRAVAVEVAHLVPQVEPARRIEAGGRLVEEQHRRLVDERHREVEPATHAARVGADAPAGGGGEADALEQLVRSLVRPRRAGCRGAPPASASTRCRSSADRWPRPAAQPRSNAAPSPLR